MLFIYSKYKNIEVQHTLICWKPIFELSLFDRFALCSLILSKMYVLCNLCFFYDKYMTFGHKHQLCSDLMHSKLQGQRSLTLTSWRDWAFSWIWRTGLNPDTWCFLISFFLDYVLIILTCNVFILRHRS